MSTLLARHSLARLFTSAPIRIGFALLVSIISFDISPGPHNVFSQSRGRTITLTRIAMLKATGGAVVSIAADAPLYRAQTRQDGNSYRVSIPNATVLEDLKGGPGVSITRVGDVVEIVVQVDPGSKVTSWANGNRLNLSIDGQLTSGEAVTEAQRLLDPKLNVDASPGPARSGGRSVDNQIGIAKSAARTLVAGSESGADGSFVSSVFSATSVFIVMGIGAFGLLGLNRLKSKKAVKAVRSTTDHSKGQQPQPEMLVAQPENVVVTEQTQPAANTVDQPAPSAVAVRPGNSNSSALYGTYRVAQEVGKLVVGQSHRLDVLASRSPDDRRAIEASLMNTILSAESHEDSKQRARRALEEYGFVARQCAALLLATEACDRMAAARTVGEIKSPIALPFLLEALYDTETSVRNQAIASIGELKLPAAIGALLDLARLQPEVPSALLSRSLSACSVEGLDFFNNTPSIAEPVIEVAVQDAPIAPPVKYEPQVALEELPDTLQDGGLVRALGDLKDANGATRAQAIQDLGQFRAQVSVQALLSIVRIGVVPAFRAQAISSLGRINHHSVFPAVLIGMADDSREVRAAAARALNRLTFDRGDAYVHLLQAGDDETVRAVARSCVQAGIVSQAIDRLASNDQRQAYEAFSLVSLLVRAEMTDSVFDAIFNHPNLEVRLSAAKVLAATRAPKVIARLRTTAKDVAVRDEVRAALLAALRNADDSEGALESGREAIKNES